MPIAGTGFVVAASSGICLLATKATEYVDNPFLYIKFSAIALGLANVGVLYFTSAWKARALRDLLPKEQTQLARIGGISLLCWLTAVTAGRMIGYW